MYIPFWFRLSLVLGLAIAMGTWFSGEATRTLQTDFLMDTVRRDMQRTTALLAGLIAEGVITGDERLTRAIIEQYATGWSDITFIHVMNDEGYQVTEWQKRPVKFGPGIRKFEAPVSHGGQEFGVLSVYVDLGLIHRAIAEHVSTSRRQAALLLLGISMLLVFCINFLTLGGKQEHTGEQGP